jgi:hypothetical protein
MWPFPHGGALWGGDGVDNMELLNVIRRMSLRLTLRVREIARRTRPSRNMVKTRLKADTVAPTFAIQDRASTLDPFAEKLAGWLKSEGATSRKQRRTLNLLHRLTDGKVMGGPTLDTPQSVALHLDPKANVARYDGLRAQIAGGRDAS